MRRWLRGLARVALLSALMGAGWGGAATPPPVEILIALEDRGGTLSTPGSTARGAYRRGGGYGAGTWASHQLRQLAAAHRLVVGEDWRIAELGLHCWRLRLAEGDALDARLQALRADARVALAQPLNHFHGQGEPARFNDPYWPLQQHLKATGATALQGLSRGAGVRVALIDSGIDTTHPDLQGRLLPGRDLVGAAHPPRSGGERHGTQVAGVLAATANNGLGGVGVAPEALLLPLRGCWEQDGGARCDSFTLARALAAALQDGAPIINLSLAGPRDPLLERLVQAALQRGTLVVGAVPRGAPADGFPAALPGVLAVRASEDPAHDGATLAAPGRDVLTLTPGGGYDFAQGASMATAQVSGLLALLRTLEPRLDATRAHTLLRGQGPVGCEALRRLRPQQALPGC